MDDIRHPIVPVQPSTHQTPTAPITHTVYQQSALDAEKEPPKQRNILSVFSGFLEIVQILVVVAVLVFLIRSFVVQPFYIIGSSMEPQLEEGQLLLIDELSYRFRAPHRGDVVVIQPPRDTKDYIKRIIGLPNETVVIDSAGHVLINGHEITEPYLSETNQFTHGTLELSLGENEFFVLGDNRGVSNDSRGGVNQLTDEAADPWTVEKKDIIGRAFFRWFPLGHFGLIKQPVYPS